MILDLKRFRRLLPAASPCLLSNYDLTIVADLLCNAHHLNLVSIGLQMFALATHH